MIPYLLDRILVLIFAVFHTVVNSLYGRPKVFRNPGTFTRKIRAAAM